MKRLAAFLGIFLAALALTGAPAAPAAARELVVAHDTHFMPFEFKGANGIYTGFDIQLWQHLARIAGIAYVLRPMDFNAILPGLESGKADVGMAGISITPDRAQKVLFSDPYYQSGLMILVRIGEKGIADVKDLAGKVVAVKSGTSSLAFVEKLGNVKQIKEFVNNDGMFFELLNGDADAVVFDMPVLRDFAISPAGRGKVKVVGPLYDIQAYGIAFPKGSEALVKKINAALEQSRRDGTYERLHRVWFGYPSATAPGERLK